MLSKNKLKWVRSLKMKKFRDLHQAFVVEGEKLVLETLQHPNAAVVELFALEDWLNKHFDLLKKTKITSTEINSRELKQLSFLTNPNQVLIILQKRNLELDSSYLSTNYALYLDGIQDPGNMGTILRIADWFGIEWVICSPDTVDVYNPKVIQASMGAFLNVKVVYRDTSIFSEELAEIPVYQTFMEGNSIADTNFPGYGVIVIGNEGRGISEDIQQVAHQKIAIPGNHRLGAESLNAAVSCGIICAFLRNPIHGK